MQRMLSSCLYTNECQRDHCAIDVLHVTRLYGAQGRPVMVLCNLKARNMRGIKSDGMLLCASNDTHEIVEPLMPPKDSVTGERVAYGDDETATQPEPETPNKV